MQKISAKEGYHCVPIGLSCWLACENSHPCLLLCWVAFCKMPLEAGLKKDGCFHRLVICAFDILKTKSEYLLFWFDQVWP